MNVDKIKLIINDMHLYNNKIESLIKTTIWVISWMGGVLTITKSCDGIASAYFLFSLSLLMEFADKIKGEKEYAANVLHAIFCILSALLLVLSFGMLITIKISTDFLYAISIILTAYMCVDCVLMWFIPNLSITKTDLDSNGDSGKSNEVECFNNNLTEGALGKIEQ